MGTEEENQMIADMFNFLAPWDVLKKNPEIGEKPPKLDEKTRRKTEKLLLCSTS